MASCDLHKSKGEQDVYFNFAVFTDTLTNQHLENNYQNFASDSRIALCTLLPEQSVPENTNTNSEHYIPVNLLSSVNTTKNNIKNAICKTRTECEHLFDNLSVYSKQNFYRNITQKHSLSTAGILKKIKTALCT